MGSGSSAQQKYVATSPVSVHSDSSHSISNSSAVFAEGRDQMERAARETMSPQYAAEYSRDHEHHQKKHDEDDGDRLHGRHCHAMRDLPVSGSKQVANIENLSREEPPLPHIGPPALEVSPLSDVLRYDMVAGGQMKPEDKLAAKKPRSCSALQSGGMSILEDCRRSSLVERMPNQSANAEELPARRASVPATLSAGSRSSVFQAGQRAQTPTHAAVALSDESLRAMRRQSLHCHRMSMTQQFERDRDKLQGDRDQKDDDASDGPHHYPESQVGDGHDDGSSPRDHRRKRRSSYDGRSHYDRHESKVGDNYNHHRRGSRIGAESQMVLQKLKDEKAKEARPLSQSSRRAEPMLVSCALADRSTFSSRAPSSGVQVVPHEDAMCGFLADDVVTTHGGPDADGPWSKMGNATVVEPDEKLGFLVVRYEKTDTLFSIKAENLLNITDKSRSGAFFANQHKLLDQKRAGPRFLEDMWEPVVGESVEILPEGLDAGRGTVVRTKDSKGMVLVRCGTLGMRKVPLKHLYRIRQEGIDKADEAFKASYIKPGEKNDFTLSVFQSVGMEFNEATAWNKDREYLESLAEAEEEFLDETSQNDLTNGLQIGHFVRAINHPIWRDQGVGVVRGMGANGMLMVQFESGGDTFALAARDLVKERVDGGKLREPGVASEPRPSEQSKSSADSSGNSKDKNSSNRRGHGKLRNSGSMARSENGET